VHIMSLPSYLDECENGSSATVRTLIYFRHTKLKLIAPPNLAYKKLTDAA
jgi:hypothetical protein